MWSQILPVVLGFVLTTLVGGAFASYLQQRSWQHQKASEVSQTLSAIVDKRWYRMMRLLAAIDPRNTSLGEGLERRMADYDAVLFEWNDQLTARLATVGAYFGEDLRRFLDEIVNEEFKATGNALQELYRTVSVGDQPDVGAIRLARAKVDHLNEISYNLSSAMMVRLRTGRVGRRAPKVHGAAYVRKMLRARGNM